MSRIALALIAVLLAVTPAAAWSDLYQRELQGTPPLAESRAEINISSATTTAVIAAVSGQKIRIYSLVLWAAAADTVVLKDGTTTINGAGFNFATQQGVHLKMEQRPLQLTAGQAFNITTSTTGPLIGWVEYTVVP